MAAEDGVEAHELTIEEILRKKVEIERSIRERFQREITVMLTDIVSSTEFYEVHGDIEGRSMIQWHNDLLGKIIGAQGGKVVRLLGDGLTATFDQPVDAAHAAIAIQAALEEENRGKGLPEQIWIRAAIHHGQAIVEEGEVFGDLVNTLARLCALAQKGEVLVSQAYVDQLRDAPTVLYEYVGTKNLKGKKHPADVYRIVRDPAQMVDRRRSPERFPAADDSDERAVWLRFSIVGDRLRLCVSVVGEQVHPYENGREGPYREGEIRQLAEEVGRCLGTVDERGRVTGERLECLRDMGRALHELLIPEELTGFIREHAVRNLVFQIDDALVHIPWELLHDGEGFLCLKYSMGRVVAASRQPQVPSRDVASRPLRMLLVTDPCGDLPAGRSEGFSIRKELERSGASVGLSVRLRSQRFGSEDFRDGVGNCEIFHYAGHFDYVEADPSRSGLVLADGKFEVGRLLSLARQSPLPSMVFSNACQSARTEKRSSEERLYGLANAFLSAGVRHYIGGIIDLFDRSSAAFAEEFYRQVVRNRSVGESLRQARLLTVKRYGEDTLTWASYVLYGDPTFRYFQSTPQSEAKPKGERKSLSRRKMIALAAGVILLVLGVVVAGKNWSERVARESLAHEGFRWVHIGRLEKAEEAFSSLGLDNLHSRLGMAAVQSRRGELEEAEKTLAAAERMDARSPYAELVRAELALNKGDLPEAETWFRRCADKGTLERWQLAECHMGMGRVFMSREDYAKAKEAFDRVIDLDPEFVQAHTAKALVLERLGEVPAAMAHHEQAVRLDGQDPIAALLHEKCRKRIEEAASAERQARVDQLVSDLLAAHRERPESAVGSNEWSSRRLYYFLLDLEVKGAPASRAGEDAYLSEFLSRELSRWNHMQPVERLLVDRLLGELKLGGSRLADPETQLQLGKILAARIVATGVIVRYRGSLQVTLRAVDTETTRIAAAVTGSCPAGEDGSVMLRKMVSDLTRRLDEAYPIRGHITRVEEGRLVIDIGHAMGVHRGMKLRVVEQALAGKELTVSEVSERECRATPDQGGLEVQEGWRVEAL